VIRRVGLDNIEIVAALDKVLALDPPGLRVDTGDPELDRELSGFRRVRIAPNRTLVIDVST
jgi:predicted polyphosphate/ATP-dependent NAD kinase